jgi:hypothetical protein
VSMGSDHRTPGRGEANSFSSGGDGACYQIAMQVVMHGTCEQRMRSVA